GEERQVGQLDALALLERLLDLLTQPRDRGDVDLDDRRELRGVLQRLVDALGDDLADAAQLLGGTPQRARLDLVCRGSGRCRLFGRALSRLLGLLGRREDVLLANATADTGTGDAGQVDAVLGGELADEGRDV